MSGWNGQEDRVAARPGGPGWLAVTLLVIATSLGAATALAAGETVVADPHAHHHRMMAPETTRSVRDYALPSVSLVRDDGKTVSLVDELNDGRPVVLSFIYTTCTSICPITSQTLSELQGKLGTARDSVHLMSISIDPEQDTPARLHDYAKKFGAGSAWQHYTGSVAASVATQRAFDVYRGDKMSHIPVTLLRAAPRAPWVRIEGFASADQLLAELRPVVAAAR
jgi:protein SCO1/2